MSIWTMQRYATRALSNAGMKISKAQGGNLQIYKFLFSNEALKTCSKFSHWCDTVQYTWYFTSVKVENGIFIEVYLLHMARCHRLIWHSQHCIQESKTAKLFCQLYISFSPYLKQRLLLARSMDWGWINSHHFPATHHTVHLTATEVMNLAWYFSSFCLIQVCTVEYIVGDTCKHNFK